MVALGGRFGTLVSGNLNCCGISLAALLPKAARDFERINIALLPPLSLLASSMDVVVARAARIGSDDVARTVLYQVVTRQSGMLS
jgi:hypothetical protein